MAGLMRFLAAFNSSRVAMVALGVVLAAVGAISDWIRLPFTTIGGFSVGYTPFDSPGPSSAAPIPQGLTFLLVVLAAATAELRGHARLRQFLAGLALASLFYHLLYLACIDGQWIETYTAQATSANNQAHLLQKFIPNSGTYRFDIPPNFEYFLPDRLDFVWQVMGRGWLIATLGACVLAAAPDGRAAARTFPLALVVAAPAAMLLMLVFGTRALWAEYLHHRGDRQLAQGAYAMALGSFTDAMTADPILARSVRFMVKVSETHYYLKGPHEPYALLALAAGDISGGKDYDNGFAKLKILASKPPGDSPFRVPYLRAAAKVERAGYALRGLSQIDGRGKNQAGRDFRYALAVALDVDPQPIDLNLMMARIELNMRQYAACSDRAERLLATGAVSHRSVKADLYSTTAHCHAFRHDYARAREAYFNSFDLDSHANYRAYQGLGGY